MATSPTERERLRARLAIARSRLALLGPADDDEPWKEAMARRGLEARVSELEAAIGVQLELPVELPARDLELFPA